ncbi:DUF397 domain-containing protein [Streptomyces sp. ISL-11]|uniref:DUF397 domain-containing protein n=1 Tax=Streptomyces sp. ISL-11 TaxID=2819174 RepID=UPI0027E553FA|nr:DUF397 domain-containing protein [Streptomyces sp. ISL-11]
MTSFIASHVRLRDSTVPTNNWQKSSYSHEGANCLYVASAGDGVIRLRESDAPDIILTATRPELDALVRSLRAGQLVRADR